MAGQIVVLLAVATAVAALAPRVHASAPLLLTAVGLGLSFVPGVPHLPLDPELVLVGFLPPLLYATAIRTPVVELRRNKRPIGLLSVGLVLFTAVSVAVVVTWVLPDVPFALAVALGAVVAPPDAVAAVAVARRVRMPRRVVTLLEGESLLNDATALVTLRTAIAALAGSVSLVGVGLDFLWAAVAGALLGWLLAELVSVGRARITDPVLDTTVSLIVPHAAYLLAEEVHGSGVIAVVAAGLILGHRAPALQNAAARVTERILWRTVQFVLESSLFLLIGLQVQTLVREAHEASTSDLQVLILALAVLATVIVSRLVWVFPASYLPRLIPAVARAEPPPPPQAVTLVGWAGMRGAVTLAAAVTIPAQVVHRPALILAAFAVVIGTLLIQGSTLPALVRLLRVRGPDPFQDALLEATIQDEAARAAQQRLEQDALEVPRTEVVESLRGWGERVRNAAWERLAIDASAGGADLTQTPAAVFHRLRLGMLEAERAVLVGHLRAGTVPHDVVERVLERVDQEEAMLEGFSVGQPGEPASTASSGASSGAGGHALPPCEHLATPPLTLRPSGRPDACAGCLAENRADWVHLRMCLTCGQVGCCDSSPRRHARLHAEQRAHPTIRSIETGETWRWCFRDDALLDGG